MSSTVYTMGTALSRAHDNHLSVAVLVDGHWVEGLVGGLDGHGVILRSGTSEQLVVKIERISIVRVKEEAPKAYPPVIKHDSAASGPRDARARRPVAATATW